MKKLLLFFLLSFSFSASADSVTYSTSYLGDKFFGDDGSECRMNYNNRLECDGGHLKGSVSYSKTPSALGYIYGDDGSECRMNYNNKLECTRQKNYTSAPNSGEAIKPTHTEYLDLEPVGYQSGALIAEGLIGILEALMGSSSSSNNKNYVNSSKPRLFDFGTTVRYSNKDFFYIVSSSNGFKCRAVNYKNICTKGSYRVTFIDCGYNVACGTDGTKFTLNENSDYRAVTTSFLSACSVDRNAKVFHCR